MLSRLGCREAPAYLCLLLALALAGSGCSGDDGASRDAGPAADAAVGLGADGEAGDAGDATPADLSPDAPVVLPELGELTMVINLGDSIAAGFGSKGAYRDLLMNNDDQAYPDYAGKDLTTRYPDLELIDRAFPGATSNQAVDQARLTPANPQGNTLILLSVGGNDLLNDYTALMDPAGTLEVARTVTKNIQKILGVFGDKSRYPGEVFVLALNVYEMTDGQGTMPADEPVVDLCDKLRAVGPLVGETLVQNFASFNGELEATFAAGGVLLVDVQQAFLGHGFNYKDASHPHYHADDPTLWIQYDCLHPNDRGHHEIRRLIWRRLFGE